MRTDIALNGSSSPTANYIGWSPRPATIRLSDPTGATSPVAVMLRNQRTNIGGQVVFAAAANQPRTDTLQLTLPLNGSPLSFVVSGKHPNASTNDRDAAIEVVLTTGGTVLSVTQLMVRVRKNANTLSDAERDRFTGAFAILNNRGAGRFRDLRNMHIRTLLRSPLAQAHGDDGFLPWHRAYLLDLERELQNIDSSVTLPYWRFDQPAPKVFIPEFIGRSAANGRVDFGTTNDLRFWTTEQGVGVLRRPSFDPATSGAGNANGPVRSQDSTLRDLGTIYDTFIASEGNPHNRAHSSFREAISDPATAPTDPLFFLLHCNVDRLWALWQAKNGRFNPAVAGSFRTPGGPPHPIGHNLSNTMWPWNGDTTPPRPTSAPGGPLASSAVTSAPAPSPAVHEMIDYQGRVNPANWLGFDYDDVPF